MATKRSQDGGSGLFYEDEDEDLRVFQKPRWGTGIVEEADDIDEDDDFIIEKPPTPAPKGILKNKATSMLDGLNTPGNPPVSRAPVPFSGLPRSKPPVRNIPSFAPRSEVQQVAQPSDNRPATKVPVVITPIPPPKRAESTKPRGGTGINKRGPSSLPSGPPPPPGGRTNPLFPVDNNAASLDSGWDFTPLRLILESPLIWRTVPPCMIPSPLSPFTKEQVEFYLIKEYGDELYKSWLQANGDWHGVPEQPDNEEADGRPATVGLKEIEERRSGVVEPGLHTTIWAPKMVGEDVYFHNLEDHIDNQLEPWESEDIEQLRPDLAPTNVRFSIVTTYIMIANL